MIHSESSGRDYQVVDVETLLPSLTPSKQYYTCPSSLTFPPHLASLLFSYTRSHFPQCIQLPLPSCPSLQTGAVVMWADCGHFALRFIFLASFLFHPVWMIDSPAAISLMHYCKTHTHLQPQAHMKVSWCVSGDAVQLCSQLSAPCCLNILAMLPKTHLSSDNCDLQRTVE